MSILVQILHTSLFVISANCIEHLLVLGMMDGRLTKQGAYFQAACSVGLAGKFDCRNLPNTHLTCPWSSLTGPLKLTSLT